MNLQRSQLFKEGRLRGRRLTTARAPWPRLQKASSNAVRGCAGTRPIPPRGERQQQKVTQPPRPSPPADKHARADPATGRGHCSGLGLWEQRALAAAGRMASGPHEATSTRPCARSLGARQPCDLCTDTHRWEWEASRSPTQPHAWSQGPLTSSCDFPGAPKGFLGSSRPLIIPKYFN